MKKIYLFILIVFVFIGNAFTQITIADNDGNDLTNTTAFLPVSPLKVNFNITNQGAGEITFVVQVVSYTIPDDASDILVCACGNCLPISLQTPPFPIGDPTVLAPGATYGDGNADVEYLSNGSIAPANVTIKVYEQGNESNFAQFTLDTEYSSVNQMEHKKAFSIYPNPANGLFTITINENTSDSELIFSNILGKTIKKVRVNNDQIQCNSNEFSKGIYFVSLISNNNVLLTKKLVVN
jgi:hypothetical protein